MSHKFSKERMQKIILCLVFILAGFGNVFAQQPDPLRTKDYLNQEKWVDSILSNMSIRQKIGQLFMIAAYSNKDAKHEAVIKKYIEEHEIGGLIFMQGTPFKQAQLTNVYQSKSKIPLLIGFDGEWGLNMRLDSTYRFPWNMTLGAIRDNELLEDLGRRVGEQHKRLGIHINFAPVVDINTNPNNPIIGNRSYGEEKHNVTEKAIAFMKGMQETNVLACGKHFPGHGDTSKDSHSVLPTILFDSIRIDTIELYPYKKLIESRLSSIMTAHLSIPSLEKDQTIPTSLSKEVITNLLQQKLGFNGLIFTDALNMKGATDFAETGLIDYKAFVAGNDVLLFSQDVTKGIKYIENAYNKGSLSEQRLDHSVRKILKAKYWSGIRKYKDIELKNLTEDLNTLQDDILHRKLVDASITLVKNKNIFPIKDVEQKIAYLKLGDEKADNKAFLEMLQQYTRVDKLQTSNLKQLEKELKQYDLVIIGFHKSNAHPWKSYKFTEEELALVHRIAAKNKTILSIFASPYSLLQIPNFSNIEAVVLGYQNSIYSQELTAQKIFGALETKGKLPVGIGNHFPAASGLFSHSLKRLSYGIPEEVGMSSHMLQHIDSIANEVVTQEMAPGMQVLVARYGKVVYQKSFGFFTADKKQKVKNTNLYDLASITKILGGLPLFMKAEEEALFNLDDSMGNLMPALKGTNKDNISIKKALAHFGQLKAWIPFYINTLDSISKEPLKKYYSTKKSKKFSIKIAEKLYLRSDYQDTIFQRIADSELREKPGYKYSGLIFYLVKDYAQRTFKEKMEVLNDKLLYKPIGATNLTYKPLEKFPKENIVPTEIDDYYRNQLLQGTVHDMGAAMMDGVSGNAGLFGNSNDVAKIMQMYLQEGFYGGKRYFKSKTINKFNTRYFEKDSVRRGLGFDKPQLNPEVLATCGCMSDKSFGHSGFTGTYTWADPETELLYVFLSNRVYPNMNNMKLVDENIRTKTQQFIIDAIKKE